MAFAKLNKFLLRKQLSLMLSERKSHFSTIQISDGRQGRLSEPVRPGQRQDLLQDHSQEKGPWTARLHCSHRRCFQCVFAGIAGKGKKNQEKKKSVNNKMIISGPAFCDVFVPEERVGLEHRDICNLHRALWFHWYIFVFHLVTKFFIFCDKLSECFLCPIANSIIRI